MVSGAKPAWAAHSKMVCRLQSWTISSADKGVASNMGPKPSPSLVQAEASGVLGRVELARQRLADVPVEAHLARGDLAQRKNGRLVLRGIDNRSSARHQLTGSLGAEEHEREAVV